MDVVDAFDGNATHRALSERDGRPAQFLSDPSSRSDPDRAHARSLVSFRVDDLRSEEAHIQSVAHAHQVIAKRLMPFGSKGTKHSSSVPVFHACILLDSREFSLHDALEG